MNSLYTCISWQYFKSLTKQHFNIHFVKIDDFFIEGTTWHSLGDVNDLSDLEIVMLLSGLEQFQEKLTVVTDASYQKDLGPFQVESSSIVDFAIKHFDLFGERFCETDVLIISFERKLAWIVHHEGVYAVVDLK